MLEDKRKALAKAEKAKPAEGVTIAEKIAAQKAHKAAIEKAKADVAFWENVAQQKDVVATEEVATSNRLSSGTEVGLSEEEAKALLGQMKLLAESANDLELTPEAWETEFGESGKVETPIGSVKMGENQYFKLLKKKRTRYFGMIKPTLTNPDVVLEEYDPKEGAERQTKYLFVKTFIKPDGSRYVHFQSVTVQKDTLEVSISSHEVNEEALIKKMQQNKLLHLNEKFLNSDRRLIEPQREGSDLVPTPNSVSSTDKDTKRFG